MFHQAKFVGATLIACSVLLAACGAGSSKEPTADPNALLTAAVQTVSVNLTQNAALTPSATPTLEPTATLAPTATQQPTSATAAATTNAATGTTPLAPTAAVVVSTASPDDAEWVSQTPADGTKYYPGQSFTMTWAVKNTGTTTWTTSYLLRFFAGSQMGATSVVAFPSEVKPGSTANLTVTMTAPSTPGEYNSWWKLTNDAGANFYDISLTIEVLGSTPTPTTTGS